MAKVQAAAGLVRDGRRDPAPKRGRSAALMCRYAEWTDRRR
jgi:hypothetical protein